jgi:hypothetical protein
MSAANTRIANRDGLRFANPLKASRSRPVEGTTGRLDVDVARMVHSSLATA